jgi:hypothetical protein
MLDVSKMSPEEIQDLTKRVAAMTPDEQRKWEREALGLNWFTDILGVLGASIPVLFPMLMFVAHYHGDEEIAALRTLIDLGLVAVLLCAVWGVFWLFYAMRASVRAFLRFCHG